MKRKVERYGSDFLLFLYLFSAVHFFGVLGLLFLFLGLSFRLGLRVLSGRFLSLDGLLYFPPKQWSMGLRQNDEFVRMVFSAVENIIVYDKKKILLI